MEERMLQVGDFVNALTIAVADKYNLSARDAVGIVMQSKLSDRFLKQSDDIMSSSINSLVASI